MPLILDNLRALYDYMIIDIDKRLDEVNLGDPRRGRHDVRRDDRRPVVPEERPARPRDDRPPRLEQHKVRLVLNRSNAFTGINVKNAESALKRPIDHQILNEYRGAISALNSGSPFMFTKADSLARPVAARLRPRDGQDLRGAGDAPQLAAPSAR